MKQTNVKASRQTQVLSKDELTLSLKKSAELRIEMKRKYGAIPFSILKLSRGFLSRQMFIYQREDPTRNTINYDKSEEKQRRLVEAGFTKPPSASQRGTRSSHSSYSSTIMPAELVAFFITYYAKAGDLYIDPFFGQGVQMQVAKKLKLDYIGFDVSEEFFAYADRVREKIDNKETKIELHLHDSRDPQAIADHCADFCFTSPPYWDTEYYGPEKEQLGNGSTYEQFLDSMYEIARAWLKKFKSSAYIVINVNDFRKEGKFYPYHADTISLFVRAGYVLHDIWVIDGLVGGLPKAFAVDFNNKRIAPKVHEYCLVLRPGNKADE
jgi:DNA modification methylase